MIDIKKYSLWILLVIAAIAVMYYTNSIVGIISFVASAIFIIAFWHITTIQLAKMLYYNTTIRSIFAGDDNKFSKLEQSEFTELVGRLYSANALLIGLCSVGIYLQFISA